MNVMDPRLLRYEYLPCERKKKLTKMSHNVFKIYMQDNIYNIR